MKGHVLTLESLRGRIFMILLSSIFVLFCYKILRYTFTTVPTYSLLELTGFIVFTIVGTAVGFIGLGLFFFAWSKDFDDEEPKKRRKRK